MIFGTPSYEAIMEKGEDILSEMQKQEIRNSIQLSGYPGLKTEVKDYLGDLQKRMDKLVKEVQELVDRPKLEPVRIRELNIRMGNLNRIRDGILEVLGKE